MATIFNRFCKEKDAFINPCDVVKEAAGFPQVCITTFSEITVKGFLEQHPAREIAVLRTENGGVPVYEITYKGKKFGLFISRVGAPACAVGLEEVIALGAKKIVQFGSCGVLDKASVGSRVIIPSSAVRDEGTSYHYIPGQEEIDADSQSVGTAARCMEQHQIPYIIGKVWTTDAVYRETRQAVKERKAQGCLAVEMECAASLAVARFRNIPILQFFYGTDSLETDQWDPGDLLDGQSGLRGNYMAVALECAVAFNGC